jgi:hypothetical protein
MHTWEITGTRWYEKGNLGLFWWFWRGLEDSGFGMTQELSGMKSMELV